MNTEYNAINRTFVLSSNKINKLLREKPSVSKQEEEDLIEGNPNIKVQNWFEKFITEYHGDQNVVKFDDPQKSQPIGCF